MFQRLACVLAWALLIFIAYVTLSPIAARPAFSTSTTVEHIVAFAVLGLLFGLAYPRHLVLVLIIVLGSAVLLELAQLITPDRHARLLDAIEKMAGGASGIVAGRAILYLHRV